MTTEKKKSNEFLCRLKYRNTLPEIPVEPKFLKYSFDAQRFVNYSCTTLEKNWNYDLMPDIVHANPIDLVDMRKWTIGNQQNQKLAPEDEELLKGIDKIHGPKQMAQSRFQRPEVTWLRRTEYISAEFFKKQEKWSEKKKERRASNLANATNELLNTIVSTFTDKEPIQHPSNPALIPVDVIPLFPDFELWANQFVQVVFESESKKVNDFKAGGILRTLLVSHKKENETIFYHYTEEGDNEYLFARDYQNPLQTNDPRVYFITTRSGNAYYNEMHKKIQLKRRRAKSDDVDRERATKLIKMERELNEEDLAKRSARFEELSEYFFTHE